ncbi:sigma 54-interacting transcriptional regulator [Acididesulfobacillus acetoxydans]|uniref:sigma 54-interacting transcriptional regulator n=1 Tax=Acididesulfobacillus acetoxydans TaxID=1561005 RepID=UPI0021C14AAA|nr:sigma 54-interacting transcriptional regulator [Acididesulfobacillus acetoxydans]
MREEGDGGLERFTRLEISAEDRLGMTSEILKVLHKLGINLHSLEVFPRKVRVKTEVLEEGRLQIIQRDLKNVQGVDSVGVVDLFDFEKSERRLLAILDAIDEGIVAVNKEFRVELFNSYCESVFKVKKEDVLGQDIRRLMGPDSPLLRLIQDGIAWKNKEVSGHNQWGDSHYIINGRPVRDDDEHIIGAVASVKDIRKAIELANAVSRTTEGAFKEIVGSSQAIERVKKMCVAVAKSNSTILLRGESGTGKELFAKAIHRLSKRRDQPFVTINCAALPDSLIESELFGYARGSFTGAAQSGKEGLFREADGGTLCLDEIGELSVRLQAKLLRVLQEGVIRKIGSNREEQVNVRIIAATNKNLEEMMRQSLFREDLFYRLNVVPIFLPPLRERKEDIPLLVNHFIAVYSEKLNRRVSGTDMAFMDKLFKHDWPGNVRELQNVIERALVLGDDDILSLQSLALSLEHSAQKSGEGDAPQPFPPGRKNLNLRRAVQMCEREVIEQALAQSKSYRAAARILGISHTALMKKVKRYELSS